MPVVGDTMTVDESIGAFIAMTGDHAYMPPAGLPMADSVSEPPTLITLSANVVIDTLTDPTVTIMVSPAHTKRYAPGTVNPDIVVVGDDGFVMVVACGFDARAVHVPVPVAAMVVVLSRQSVWSGPADAYTVHPYILLPDPQMGILV